MGGALGRRDGRTRRGRWHGRRLRRQGRRRRWLEAIREIDPAVAEELEGLRRVNPHAYRKRLVFLARRHDLFDWVKRWSVRELPPMDERRLFTAAGCVCRKCWQVCRQPAAAATRDGLSSADGFLL